MLSVSTLNLPLEKVPLCSPLNTTPDLFRIVDFVLKQHDDKTVDNKNMIRIF